MTARELGEWEAFERVFGPLTVQERLDDSAARIAAASYAGLFGTGVAPVADQPEIYASSDEEPDVELMVSKVLGLRAKHAKVAAKSRRRKKGKS